MKGNGGVVFGLSFGSVALTIWKSVWAFSLPSMTILPPKNQWRECLELDWPILVHLTLVGLRLSLTYCWRRGQYICHCTNLEMNEVYIFWCDYNYE